MIVVALVANELIVEAVVLPVTFSVKTRASTVTVPVLTAPVRPKASEVFATVVKAPNVLASTLVSVPPRFKAVKAPELTVAAPAFVMVAVAIVPAAVAEARFASRMLTAPAVIPIRPIVPELTAAIVAL